MRRFGALLMILGVNVVVASIGFGIYIAALRCAIAEAESACVQGVSGKYMGLMTSLPGTLFWLVILLGVYIFLRGKHIRENNSE